MERTLILIKPDGVKRRLIGEVIGRIERRGFDIIAMKMLVPSVELAEAHYEPHKGKDFFEPLIAFLTSGMVVALVVEGINSIELMRNMIGALNPANAQPGTIRGDFTISQRENIIHGSDKGETAEKEIKLWFPDLC
jgi:nucleoside-diphosphate kinase